ncbi:hypothetical protein [Desulfohalovibrio reitneri]|uniref:hypothetical protein n=1 Tax=Desulfohalovibrio reitneri TaxID=1307759 RepID=UPI0004A6FB05|nr:hypothetical protein [Desulfohalovibrio reitneri]
MQEDDPRIKNLEDRLRQWRAKLSELRSKADAAEAETRIEWRSRIRDLEAKRDDLEQRIRRYKESGSDAAEELRTGAEKAAKQLGQALNKALSRF